MLYVAYTNWQRQQVSLASGLGATLDLWTVGLGGCWPAPSARRVLAGFCGGANTGRWHATGLGFREAGTEATAAFLDLALGAELEIRIFASLYVGLTVQQALPIARGRVAYRQGPRGDVVEIWKTWPSYPLAFLHASYAFR